MSIVLTTMTTDAGTPAHYYYPVFTGIVPEVTWTDYNMHGGSDDFTFASFPMPKYTPTAIVDCTAYVVCSNANVTIVTATYDISSGLIKVTAMYDGDEYHTSAHAMAGVLKCFTEIV